MIFRFTIHQIVESSQRGRIEVTINGKNRLLICRYYYSIYRKKWVINHYSSIPFKEIYFRSQKDLKDYVSFKIKVYINQLKESIVYST